jgi:hypothetical protein
MAHPMDGPGLIIAYDRAMKLTFWSDERIVASARKKAKALGKSLDDLIRDCLRTLADDDPEMSSAEFSSLSGCGDSSGWRFNRDEIHNRE